MHFVFVSALFYQLISLFSLICSCFVSRDQRLQNHSSRIGKGDISFIFLTPLNSLSRSILLSEGCRSKYVYYEAK